MTKEQRKQRVLARGEFSNHSHVICGDAEVSRNTKGQIIVQVGTEGAILKHILEREFIETGEEIWTKEHKDIPLEKGKYKFVQQQEFNPYTKVIQAVQD